MRLEGSTKTEEAVRQKTQEAVILAGRLLDAAVASLAGQHLIGVVRTPALGDSIAPLSLALARSRFA